MDDERLRRVRGDKRQLLDFARLKGIWNFHRIVGIGLMLGLGFSYFANV